MLIPCASTGVAALHSAPTRQAARPKRRKARDEGTITGKVCSFRPAISPRAGTLGSAPGKVNSAGEKRDYPAAPGSGITGTSIASEGYRLVMMLSRQAYALALLAPLLLSGCNDVGSSVGDTLGLGAAPPRTSGLVVADEPLAAKIGAAILTQGGSAADAVTAMFFTMTATYPAAAGLGGGGICLVQSGGSVREYDFLARRANSNGA